MKAEKDELKEQNDELQQNLKNQDELQAEIERLRKQVEKTSAMYTTNEKLTKPLSYCKNQKEYLETFLEDGRIQISNNY